VRVPSRGDGPASARRARVLLSAAALLAGLVGASRGTQDAVANGDTRTLTIHHTHTKETAQITFRRNGRYDPQALEQLNWLLRDWRLDEPTRMDPRLFDIVWEVYREVGSSEPIHVVSAYRSPKTNNMLRRRSRGVAKHSQHTLGKAMDFYLPDVGMDRVRAIAMRLQHGGVGYYPTAYNPFVHLDAGSVRSWPRMTHDQLARLFPSGRTVHLPADGRPMPGYEEARAEILARGGQVAGIAAVAEGEEAAQPRRKSFWATLFGGGNDDEDSDYYASQPTRAAAPRPRQAPPQAVAAYAPAPEDDTSSRFLAMRGPQAEAPRREVVRQEVARREIERQEAARIEAARSEPPRRGPDPEEADAPLASPALPRPALPQAPAPARLASLETPPLQTQSAAAPPRFTWQAGPAADAERTAIVPLPPRRPDAAAPYADPVLAAAAAGPVPPLPPVRPLALAYAAPAAAIAAEFTADLRGAARPEQTAAIPAAGAAPAAPLQRAAAAAPADERAALRALFAAAADEPEPRAQPGLATARAKPAPVAPASLVAGPGPGLKLGFSQAPAGDLGSGRFTGPAVKPLPVMR
jgi:uncharacterized protein YcbK (DUF882 family)